MKCQEIVSELTVFRDTDVVFYPQEQEFVVGPTTDRTDHAMDAAAERLGIDPNAPHLDMPLYAANSHGRVLTASDVSLNGTEGSPLLLVPIGAINTGHKFGPEL